MSEKASGAGSGAIQGATAGAVLGPWGAAVGAVVGGLLGAFAGRQKDKVKKEAAAAANLLAESANQQRAAKNSASIAAAELGRTVQAISNQRALAVGVKNDAALKAGLTAAHDADTARTFEGRIAAAERAGGFAAQAAISGVTGGSYEVIQGTLALQEARRESAARRRADQVFSQFEATVGNNAANMIGGLDIRTILPTLDQTTNSTQNRPDLKGNVFSGAAGAINDIGVNNVVTAAEGIWKAITPPAPTFEFSQTPDAYLTPGG